MSDEKTILNAPKVPELPRASAPQLPRVSPMPAPKPLSGISAPSLQRNVDVPTFKDVPVANQQTPTIPLDVNTQKSQGVISQSINSQNASTAFTQQVQVEGKKTSTNEAVEKKNGIYDNNFAADLNLPPKVLETKIMGSIVAALFFFGLMMGCLMFGGDVVHTTSGLEGVVHNPDVRKGTYRCGMVPLTRGCVLYIMNSKNYDRKGVDFYQEAQNITGVPSYTLQLSNVRYASTPIQPGFIAEIYIPPR